MRTVRLYFIGDNLQDMYASPDVTTSYTDAVLRAAEDAASVGYVDVKVGSKQILYLNDEARDSD